MSSLATTLTTFLLLATLGAAQSCTDSCVTKMANANLEEVVLETMLSGWMTLCTHTCFANQDTQSFSCFDGSCDLIQRIELCAAPEGKKWGLDVDLEVSQGEEGTCSLHVCTPLVNQADDFLCSTLPDSIGMSPGTITNGTARFRGAIADGGVTFTPILRMACDEGLWIEISRAELILVDA